MLFPALQRAGGPAVEALVAEHPKHKEAEWQEQESQKRPGGIVGRGGEQQGMNRPEPGDQGQETEERVRQDSPIGPRIGDVPKFFLPDPGAKLRVGGHRLL